MKFFIQIIFQSTYFYRDFIQHFFFIIQDLRKKLVDKLANLKEQYLQAQEAVNLFFFFFFYKFHIILNTHKIIYFFLIQIEKEASQAP